MPPTAPPVVQQSILTWAFKSLGPLYIGLFAVCGGLALVVTLVLVLRGRGPLAAAGLVLAANMPLLLGLFGMFEGAIQSFSIIATSTTSPRPSDLAAGISTALMTPLIGLLISAPCYLLAIVGSVVQSLRTPDAIAASE